MLHSNGTRRFSWQCGLNTVAPEGAPHRASASSGGFPYRLLRPKRLDALCNQYAAPILLRHASHLVQHRYRNINRFPIGYPFRVHLRVPTNPGRTTLPQVTLGFRGERFSLSSRYSCLHSLLCFVQRPSRVRLLPTAQCSPTDSFLSHSFGGWLQPPYIFGAKSLNW